MADISYEKIVILGAKYPCILGAKMSFERFALCKIFNIMKLKMRGAPLLCSQAPSLRSARDFMRIYLKGAFHILRNTF